MTKGKKKVFEHLFHKSTQRKFVYKQVTPYSADLAHDAAIPYVYFDKDFIVSVLAESSLGTPPMLEITVRALYPDDDQGEIVE